MKQVLQSLKTGATEIAEVPCPGPTAGQLLLRTRRTLISAGTERMLVEFGQASLLEKARKQPDKVKQVLEKVRTDGLLPTFEAVRNKLDQPLPLGYCHVGEVLAVGAGVSGFAVGDRIASNGKHAEVVSVPVNLCARVPDAVSDDQAAFTVLGSIALQGVRLAAPTLGEAVVVTGLGLVGLMAIQLLRANGCRVLGLDFDPEKVALARRLGAEAVDLSAGGDPVQAALQFSRGRGVDAVIVTAATQSSEPMHQAALMCRQRGRIVLVGVTGLELSRDDFFKKELTFQVSCSYGPGRYDPEYEEKGRDYPAGLVRWTEQRNFEAVLDMLADKRLDVEPLVSHRFAIAEAARAYELVTGGKPSLGIVLEYPGPAPTARIVSLRTERSPSPRTKSRPVRVSFVGSGNYSTAVLIPAFKAGGAILRTAASSGGVSGLHAGRKFGFAQTTTDSGAVLSDPETDAVVVTTRHDSHASFVLRALESGKHVFVEKPLCLTVQELDDLRVRYEQLARDAAPPEVMVGFNRRFAPHVVKMKELLAGIAGPKAFVMTVNAGALPPDHWTQDPDIGGGRIVGEACHFVDLLRFLAGTRIVGHERTAMTAPTADTATITLRFEDGSIGTIHYFANGTKSFPKERLEVFASGRVLQLDNYRRLTGFGWPSFKVMKSWRQDKGQKACAAAFVRALAEGHPSPIPFEELVEVSRVSIEVAKE